MSLIPPVSNENINDLGVQQKVNFSKLLQESLKKELNL